MNIATQLPPFEERIVDKVPDHYGKEACSGDR